MYANNTILERGQLIAGMFLTVTGKLDVVARPLPGERRPARRQVRSNRRPVRIAKALPAAA